MSEDKSLDDITPVLSPGRPGRSFLPYHSAFAAGVRWGLGGQLGWLIGGLLLGAVVPFTFIVILPTTELLLDLSLDLDSPESAALLRRWGHLHAVRSAANLVAFLIFVLLLAW